MTSEPSKSLEQCDSVGFDCSRMHPAYEYTCVTRYLPEGMLLFLKECCSDCENGATDSFCCLKTTSKCQTFHTLSKQPE